MEAPILRSCRPISRQLRSLTTCPLHYKKLLSTTTRRRAQQSEAAKGSSILHRRTPSRFTESLDALRSKDARDVPEAGPGVAPSEEDIALVRRRADSILQHQSLPEEKEVLSALDAIETAASKISGMQNATAAGKTEETSPASAILSLDSRPSTKSANVPTSTIDLLSSTATKLLSHPVVDITPALLKRYTLIQSLLLRPESLPAIFDLYRNKPIPTLSNNKKSITYSPPKSDAIATAIPATTANLALTAALHAHDLPLALEIITSTYSTTSYRRAKIFRQALPPIAGASLAPLAMYSLATQLSHLQNMWPTENFTAIAFAGMFTYTTAVGTIGYVALTTANDQMERVTWATGLPLWERWVREEERAAIDKVARHFGFREKWRWGEEEGEEWDTFREWVGTRGMVLDRVGLMEGME